MIVEGRTMDKIDKGINHKATVTVKEFQPG